ncbi:hypothetical protein [Pseudomonas saliphila]|uniref:hypothetical protein n=1 Tax=Pseudomonas saliphila TaxID=2586906 RepID=UPI00123BC37B|nr:hypothetical protein [Pseudomonas saliphila]
MKPRYWGMLLLGKSLAVSAALLLVVGAESNASIQEPHVSTLSQQIVYSRPGTASTASNITEQTDGPRWVF